MTENLNLEQKLQVLHYRLGKVVNGLLAAVVASRYGFGFVLPMTPDGKSLRDHGLKRLGYRFDQNGDLEKIPTPSIQELSTPQGNKLRIFQPEDSSEIYSLIDRNREHLSQHGDTTSAKYPTEDEVLHSIIKPSKPDKLRYGIWTADNDYVGTINFTPDKGNPKSGEIGYYVGQGYSGKGYATDAAVALTQFLQNHGWTKPYAKVHKDNLASQKVLQKAGFIASQGVDEEDNIKFTKAGAS